jgi:hypothetical protein
MGCSLQTWTTDFTASPLMGALPLTVAFTDASSDHGTAITAWAWDFGDTNTAQNPQHTYCFVKTKTEGYEKAARKGTPIRNPFVKWQYFSIRNPGWCRCGNA